MKSTSTLLRRLEKEPLHNTEGFKTDFPEFDKFTKGLQLGQLIVMAGRPGMGNLAFTRCLVLNTSIRHHNPVAIFLLEESSKTYLQKMIATEAGISHYELKRGGYSEEITEKLNQTKQIIAKAPIFINDDLEFSLSMLKAKIKQHISVFGMKLLVINGYHLLTHNPDSKLSRKQELDIISQELKLLAEDLNIIVLITHEFPEIKNYNCDEDVQPSLKELYNDTPIAKYADLITFLYRPEYYKFKTWYDSDESCECEAELIIAKNRHGYIHSFRLFFSGYRSRFNEIDDQRFKKQKWVATS